MQLHSVWRGYRNMHVSPTQPSTTGTHHILSLHMTASSARRILAIVILSVCFGVTTRHRFKPRWDRDALWQRRVSSFLRPNLANFSLLLSLWASVLFCVVLRRMQGSCYMARCLSSVLLLSLWASVLFCVVLRRMQGSCYTVARCLLSSALLLSLWASVLFCVVLRRMQGSCYMARCLLSSVLLLSLWSSVLFCVCLLYTSPSPRD